MVVCRECTAAEYGLDHSEATGLAVWVRVEERDASPLPKKKPAKAKKAVVKKANVWDRFLPGNT